MLQHNRALRLLQRQQLRQQGNRGIRRPGAATHGGQPCSLLQGHTFPHRQLPADLRHCKQRSSRGVHVHRRRPEVAGCAHVCSRQGRSGALRHQSRRPAQRSRSSVPVSQLRWCPSSFCPSSSGHTNRCPSSSGHTLQVTTASGLPSTATSLPPRRACSSVSQPASTLRQVPTTMPPRRPSCALPQPPKALQKATTMWRSTRARRPM